MQKVNFKSLVLFLCAFLSVGVGAEKIKVKTVSVSHQHKDYSSKLMVDNNPDTFWAAGRVSPAWVEFDLGEKYDLSRIEMIVAQSPNGCSAHHIIAGPSRDNMKRVHSLRGYTSDHQRLNIGRGFKGVRYIRIHTEYVHSWVAWREVNFWGELDRMP